MDPLVKLALVGTAKVHPSSAPSDHPADEMFAAFVAEDAERRLLLQAGARYVCDRSGHLARDGVARLPPAPVETGPLCSVRLTGILQNAIVTKEYDLLCEFLREMDQIGLRLPPELLPQALGVSDAAARERLLPVLGERGRWLSRLCDEWRWGTEGTAILSELDVAALRTVWDEGVGGERKRALATLRRSNAALAREWLATAIDNEKAEQRAALLETFEHGLTAEDEPFLEARLDDRSEQARRVAAQWLARLADSQLAQRMLARATAMLSLKKSGLIRKTVKLVCEPPEEIDKS